MKSPDRPAKLTMSHSVIVRPRDSNVSFTAKSSKNSIASAIICARDKLKSLERRSTRRALLGQVAAAWAASAQQPSLGPMRPGHPRLIALDSDIERLRVLVRENAQARRLL